MTLSRLLAFLLLASALLAADPAFAAEPAERAEALAAIRAAAAGRDFAELKTQLAAADKLRGEPKYDAELDRLDELCDLLQQFWASVDRGARAIQNEGELHVGEQIVSIVEFDGQTLILRVAGQNKRYTLANVPAKLCLTLAEKTLDAKAAKNNLFFGAFLLLDGKGDRVKARQYFDAAARGQVDVARFLPEFEIAPAIPAIPIEIPTLNPAQKMALSEKNWQVRERTAKSWTRAKGDAGLTQDAEGRLLVKLPQNGAAGMQYQVAAKRTFAGNFAFRMILVDARGDQTFCFASPNGDDSGYSVTLPAGTLQVELVRANNQLACRINGRELPLTPYGRPRPAMAGIVAITSPPGGEFSVAAVQWTGR